MLINSKKQENRIWCSNNLLFLSFQKHRIRPKDILWWVSHYCLIWHKNSNKTSHDECVTIFWLTLKDCNIWSRFVYLIKVLLDFRDEGIILKDLSSKWEPGDRSGKWLKLKPDYIRASTDLDVLIIGKICSAKTFLFGSSHPIVLIIYSRLMPW